MLFIQRLLVSLSFVDPFLSMIFLQYNWAYQHQNALILNHNKEHLQIITAALEYVMYQHRK